MNLCRIKSVIYESREGIAVVYPNTPSCHRTTKTGSVENQVSCEFYKDNGGSKGVCAHGFFCCSSKLAILHAKRAELQNRIKAFKAVRAELRAVEKAIAITTREETEPNDKE